MSPYPVIRTHLLGAIAALAVLAGCSRAPTLPYELGGLGGDGACGRTSAAGCAGLSPANIVAASASVPRPAAAPPRSLKGVIRLVVSLPQQRLYAFRDGVLVAQSAVSTGKRGHATPAGVFHILEKQVHHRSNRYSNAPMPYMERLTQSGIALHAGHLPGYPASHGCIRLPMGFARRLYRMTSFRSTVTIIRTRWTKPRA